MKEMMILLFLLVSFCMSSCQKDDIQYSCDPNVEKWANENSAEISKMDRVAFLKLSNDSYQKAAYRVFDIEKKRTIWKEKYHELKSLNWSESEWNHIDLIYSLALDTKLSVFESMDIENDDELLKFIYHWQEYANEVLGWNKKQIFAICHSIGKVVNKQGDLDLNDEQKIPIMLNRTESGMGFECSCSQVSSYCDILDHEGPDYTYCRTPSGGSCKEIPGCGLFWLFTCTGVCSGLFT